MRVSQQAMRSRGTALFGMSQQTQVSLLWHQKDNHITCGINFSELLGKNEWWLQTANSYITINVLSVQGTTRLLLEINSSSSLTLQVNMAKPSPAPDFANTLKLHKEGRVASVLAHIRVPGRDRWPRARCKDCAIETGGRGRGETARVHRNRSQPSEAI